MRIPFPVRWHYAVLTGIATFAWSLPIHADHSHAAGTYDFAYRLSGDRRVAPVQVFDDGRTTWLQYHPGQVLPAIFAGEDGNPNEFRLAPYTRQGPYLVIEGVVPAIVMRLGNATARADYIGKAPRTGLRHLPRASFDPWQRESHLKASDHNGGSFPTTTAQTNSGSAGKPDSSWAAPHQKTAVGWGKPVNEPINMMNDQNASSGRAGGAMSNRTVPSRENQRIASSDFKTTPKDASAPNGTALFHTASMPVASVGQVLEFDAAVTDGNMRKTLQRWAREAGWRFDNEHWTVNVDIPLTASASFGSDFRDAVRGLLSATELADHPLQPCFYSNRVLRVVPLSQACDRTVSPVAAVTPAS